MTDDPHQRIADMVQGALEMPDGARSAEPSDSQASGSMPPVPPTPTEGASSAGGRPPVNWDLVKLCAQEPETDIGNARRFLHRHGDTTLSVEGLGWAVHDGRRWGIDYFGAEVRPLAADLGRRVRVGMGMQPALGWGTGKFTARAGAHQTGPGRMRLVEPEQTAAFLAGQAVTLLPLDEDHLRQLHWLGVRTLGQFARLPAAAVWQRFGAAGKLAQQWARGKDDRPVCGAAVRPAAPVMVTFDPLACTVQAAAGKLMASLRPLLDDMQAQLTGVLRLHMACMFDGGGEYNGVVDFLTPENRGERVQAGVTQFLGKGVWPAPLASVRWTLLASGEVSVAQLRLFAGLDANVLPVADTAAALTDRYGAVFFQGQRHNANHPIPERRSRFVSLGAGGRSGDVATLA